MDSKFDLDDVLSIYLTKENRTWVERLYCSNIPAFLDACKRFNRVKVTNSAVSVARHIQEKHGIVMFPHVLKSVTTTLGASNWRMESVDDTVYVQSRVPISIVVDQIKHGEKVRIQSNDGGKLEIIY